MGAARGEASGGATGAGSAAALSDRYRVVARIGVGGTAMVYRCVDLHTERIVAVKVLRTNGPLIPEAASRFWREARLAASLSHPHIVRVLDYGYTVPPMPVVRNAWDEEPANIVPYLAMEYVYGATLKEVIRRRSPIPFDWVWRVGEQLCAALSAAHVLGVVHRDVKPQNVLILDSPLDLYAKLTDFGIARQIGGDYTNLTAEGQVLGTPDYLSPEQVLGEPGGPSSDLYALGIVLYEMITGRLPFEAETPLAAASRRMVADPPPLSAYRRDVPLPLQEIILLALRREVGERFANAQEFAQALRWSRERSPEQQREERGAWVIEKTSQPAAQAPQPAPAMPAMPASAEDEQPMDEQASILRVTTQLPGFAETVEAVEASEAGN